MNQLLGPDIECEPYVRATLDDGTVRDGKATAWTATLVLFKYAIDHTHCSQWIKATQAQRIKRSESAWIDLYHNAEHYEDE